MDLFRASMPPMASMTVRQLMKDGLTGQEAVDECERLRAEWREWDRDHGPAWRLLHDCSKDSDRARLRGMTVDDVLDDGVPPDPPGSGAH